MTVLQAQEPLVLLLAFALLWPLNFYLFIYFNSTVNEHAICSWDSAKIASFNAFATGRTGLCCSSLYDPLHLRNHYRISSCLFTKGMSCCLESLASRVRL